MALDRGDERIHDEVAHHLDELRAQLEASGMSSAEAQAEALRRFGDPERIERTTRAIGAASGGPGGQGGLSGGLRDDLRQALRGLRRAPAFTGAVVATLALALGATVTVVGVVYDVLLRPLAVEAPESLVVLRESQAEQGIADQATSWGTFQDWRHDLTTISALAGWEWSSRVFEDPERPEELLSVEITGGALAMLAIRPVVGRALGPDDETVGTPATTLMISHDLWERRFGGDPGVIGRTIPIDGVGREVVGVLPERIEVIGTNADLFMPSSLVPADPANRGSRTVTAVARMAPGVTLAAVQTEVARRTEAIAAAHPTSARGWSATAVPLTDWVLGDARLRLLLALAAVVLVLAVAVVNATNLVFVRAADARREMAVRAALGAGRGALVRLRLVESLVIAAAGGAMGLLLALSLRHWFAGLDVAVLPRGLGTDLSWATVGAAVLIVIVTGIAMGVVPALRGAQAAIAGVARGTGIGAGAGGGRGRSALVVAQLALTVVLLVGAGLLVRTARAVAAVDLGFRPEGLVAARVSLSDRRYPTNDEQTAYLDQVLERVRALPGVTSAGVTSALPMDPVAANFDLPTRADPATAWGEAPQADFRMVDDQVMATMGYRLVEGRLFRPDDRGGPPVAVVNRSLADLLWSTESAVGRQVQSVWRQDRFSEVVGVVEDTRFYGPREGARPELFFPLDQVTWGFLTIVARGGRDPATLLSALERAMIEVDPHMPPQDVFAVDRLVDDATATDRLYALLLAAFALVALALAGTGVFGVLAYSVRLRSREMGVRMALGASRTTVVVGIVGRGVLLALAGVAIGLSAAVPASRMLAGVLYGVRPTDPVTLLAVALMLIAVAIAACLIPALRAARLDPVTILSDA